MPVFRRERGSARGAPGVRGTIAALAAAVILVAAGAIVVLQYAPGQGAASYAGQGLAVPQLPFPGHGQP